MAKGITKRGGARQNSGPQPAKLKVERKKSPLAFLLDVMNNEDASANNRVRAAIEAAKYMHARKGEGGKKDERKEAAEKAGRGKYAPSGPPKLRVVNA
jgi:phage terminase small subunit